MSQSPRPSSKNPSKTPAPDVGEIQACGTCASEILEAPQRRGHDRQIPRQPVLASKREPGGDDTRPRVGRDREPASLAINRSQAFGRAPRLAEERGDHRTDHRPSILHEGDADADNGEAAHEVGGPVHRVDHPHAVAARAAGLLGEDRDVGRALAEHANRRLLGRPVDLGDVVAGALDLGGQRPRTGVGSGDQRSRRRGGGDGELTQSLALLHPTRVPAAGGTACAWLRRGTAPCARRAPDRGRPC